MLQLCEHIAPEPGCLAPAAGYESVARSSLAGNHNAGNGSTKKTTSSSNGSSGGGSSRGSRRSGGSSSEGKPEDVELHRTLRLLLRHGRLEAAVHLLQQEWSTSGQRLNDEGLR